MILFLWRLGVVIGTGMAVLFIAGVYLMISAPIHRWLDNRHSARQIAGLRLLLDASLADQPVCCAEDAAKRAELDALETAYRMSPVEGHRWDR